ncbi:hypothetical protein DPMN_134911 [Dreissena polymorpha]|uniref:Uncharacterized protein n=1 Tax=Dreissena polymorpha TaxID=45954 RepID=A0A9D4FX30_DREPO|nr:hypothetical protein DPMN_134911 [Dreissena polymorpha]
MMRCTLYPNKCWGVFLKELHNIAFPPSHYTSSFLTKSNIFLISSPLHFSSYKTSETMLTALSLPSDPGRTGVHYHSHSGRTLIHISCFHCQYFHLLLKRTRQNTLCQKPVLKDQF